MPCRSDTSMPQGQHWMTKCPKAHRVVTHTKMRDVVAAIYRALHVHVTVEVRGLYMRNSPHMGSTSQQMCLYQHQQQERTRRRPST